MLASARSGYALLQKLYTEEVWWSKLNMLADADVIPPYQALRKTVTK
jgi:hypothetical protein